MISPYWPLAGLRLRTARLELRWPSLADLDALAELAAAGVHDPGIQPFAVAWTDVSPQQRARSVLQWHWSRWGAWQPSDWELSFVVVRDRGEVVGTQAIGARDFALRREVSTGSWLGMRFQGGGIGTEMREAVLHLAFAGLRADYATSSAFDDNAASLGVSRKLGYADDGVERLTVRGRAVTSRRLRLSRQRWQSVSHQPVEIEGLEPCLPLFGLEESS